MEQVTMFPENFNLPEKAYDWEPVWYVFAKRNETAPTEAILVGGIFPQMAPGTSVITLVNPETGDETNPMALPAYLIMGVN